MTGVRPRDDTDTVRAGPAATPRSPGGSAAEASVRAKYRALARSRRRSSWCARRRQCLTLHAGADLLQPECPAIWTPACSTSAIRPGRSSSPARPIPELLA